MLPSDVILAEALANAEALSVTALGVSYPHRWADDVDVIRTTEIRNKKPTCTKPKMTR